MPVKIKVFAVVMAVMCVISCMCVTAFAAEAPAGAVMLENGGTYQGLSNKLETPYAIAAENVESITIEGLYSFSSVYGWNGTEWINITGSLGSVEDSVTINTADYPEYSYFTGLLGMTGADNTITVTWTVPPAPGMLDNLGSISSAIWSGAKDATNFVMKTPLAQIVVILGIIGVGCLLAKRYLFAH